MGFENLRPDHHYECQWIEVNRATMFDCPALSGLDAIPSELTRSANVVAVAVLERGGAAMKLVRQDLGQALVSRSPIFEGEVVTQNLVAEGDAELLRVTAVTFQDGARNKPHRHTTDQVLVVTAGRGIVATDAEELLVETGDVILVPAGERHWHGAVPGGDFTHLSILTPGEMTIED